MKKKIKDLTLREVAKICQKQCDNGTENGALKKDTGTGLKLKPIKNIPTNDLTAFVNTIYDYFFHEISNFEEILKTENEPFHYLLIQTRLEENRKALRKFEKIVYDFTEYVNPQPTKENKGGE